MPTWAIYEERSALQRLNAWILIFAWTIGVVDLVLFASTLAVGHP